MPMDSDSLQERTLHSEPAFSGKLLKLRIDTVELPNGRQASREIVEHPGATAIVPLDEDGNVLLVRQWRHPIGQVTLEIPAGTLDPKETVEHCARRELVEETGYFPGRLEKLGSIYPSPGYSNEQIVLFLASKLQHQGQQPHPQADPSWAPDPDESLQTAAIPLREAVQRCTAGAISDAKSVAGILLAWERLQGSP